MSVPSVEALWPDDTQPEPGCWALIVRGLLFVAFTLALGALIT